MDSTQKENQPAVFKMADLGNEVGENGSESRNRPSKSILKPNNDITLDQNSLSALLKNSNSKTLRRVSFAPEVTLHKIDVIPEYNRRETISFMPNATNTTWGEEESDDDDSDSDDDTSFLNLESDADKIVSGINRINNEVRSMNLHDSPEQTDDDRVLPPPPYPPPSHLRASIQFLTEETVLPSPSYPPSTVPENKLTAAETEQEIFHDSLAVLPPPDVDAEEEEMELTAQIPSVPHPQTLPPSPSPLKDDSRTLSVPPPQENLNESTTILPPPPLLDTPSSVLPPPTENEEEDMELTSQLPPPVNVEEEEEMDLTTPFKPLQTTSTIEVPTLSTDIPPQLSSSDDELENEDGMEFTSNLGKPIQTNPIVQNEEVTMDITTVFSKQSIEINGPSNPPEEEEVTMDITKPFTANPPSTEPILETVQETEQETIQETVQETVQEPHQETDQNSVNQSENNEETSHQDEVLDVVSDSQSQPMELTQQSTNLIVENGVDVTSQPMELSQENGVVVEESNKRQLSEEPDQIAKKSKYNDYEMSTTTTIPLAEVSNQSIDLGNESDEDDDFEPVSLNEFLGEIGVRFYDDLEIGSHPANRISLALSDKEFEMEDYYKANNKLPILEVFQLSCRELTTKINQDKDQYDSIKDSIFPENQDLFKSYFKASFPEQLNLKSQFQLIKELARQQAKKIWYDWRIKLMNNILNDLQVNFEVLEHDKLIIVNNIEILDSVYDQIKHQYSILKQELTSTIESQTEFKKIDVSQIKDFKNNLMNINQELNDYQQRISEKQKELNDINALIGEKDEEISSLRAKLAETEDQLKDRKKFTAAEIETLTLRFKVLQAVSKLKYIESGDHKAVFEFDNVFKVEIDFDNLTDSQSISYNIIDERIPTSIYNHEVLTKFITHMNSSSSSSVLQNFSDFKKNWKALSQVSREIYKVSLKFPVDINIVDNDLQFTVRYYSRKNDFKASFTASISLKDILEYSSKVKVAGTVLRSPEELTNDFIVDSFLAETVSNNLLTKSTITIV